jgi:hypothetical protein
MSEIGHSPQERHSADIRPEFIMRFWTLIFLGIVNVLAGCGGSARYQINIGNGHSETAITDVKVHVNDNLKKQYMMIPPQKTGVMQPKSGELPNHVEVHWTDRDGVNHSETVEISSRIQSAFHGKIFLEISEDNQLTLTPVENVDSGGSELPWDLPEDWEGSINFPGMQ